MKTLNPNVAKWRANHHEALAAVFGVHPGNGLSLWRKLRRIESEASNLSVRYSNGEIDSDKWENAKADILRRVRAISGTLPKGFFLNGDPRGYALKLDSEQARNFPGLHKDWGGYGCLAAEIND